MMQTKFKTKASMPYVPDGFLMKILVKERYFVTHSVVALQLACQEMENLFSVSENNVHFIIQYGPYYKQTKYEVKK